MSERRRPRRRATTEPAMDGDDEAVGFRGLHWLAAGLFLAAGTEAGLGERRGDYRPEDAVRWGPLIAAPLAAGAHALRALYPGRTSRVASQLLDGVAVAVGSAGVAGALYAAARDEPADRAFESRSSLQRRLPSFAPLTFAVAGLMGALLDREERIEEDRREQLRDEIEAARRRARIVDRLVPRRKTRFDRVVLHI